MIESDGLSEGIVRTHVKLIEYHVKAGYDTAGNIPKFDVKDAILSHQKFAFKDAILSHQLADPGTREVVLHLAEHRQQPSVAKEDKSGWEQGVA